MQEVVNEVVNHKGGVAFDFCGFTHLAVAHGGLSMLRGIVFH